MSDSPVGEIKGLQRLQELVEPSAFDEWAEEYQQRWDGVRAAVDDAIYNEIDRPALHPQTHFAEAVFNLRRSREDLAIPFCLVIHSGDVDEELIVELDPRDGVFQSVIDNLSPPQAAWKAATIASVLLEAEGIACMTLSSDDARDRPGFLNYACGDDPTAPWFGRMALTAELAQAVLFFGGMGHALQAELVWLKTAGLQPRLIVHLNGRLVQLVDEENRWFLPGIGEAVRTAASAGIGWV